MTLHDEIVKITRGRRRRPRPGLSPRPAARLRRRAHAAIVVVGPEELDLPVHKRNRLRLLADIIVFYGARGGWAEYGRFSRHNHHFSGTVRIHAGPVDRDRLLADAGSSPLFAADPHAPQAVHAASDPAALGSTREIIYVEVNDDVELAMIADAAGQATLDVAFAELGRVPAPHSGSILAAELHFDVNDHQRVNLTEFYRVLKELEFQGYIIKSYGPAPLTSPTPPRWAGNLVCPWECGMARA